MLCPATGKPCEHECEWFQRPPHSGERSEERWDIDLASQVGEELCLGGTVSNIFILLAVQNFWEPNAFCKSHI